MVKLADDPSNVPGDSTINTHLNLPYVRVHFYHRTQKTI